MHQDRSVWLKFSELVKRFDHLSPYPVTVRDVNATSTSSQSIEALADVENTPSSSSTSNEGANNAVVDNTQSSSNVADVENTPTSSTTSKQGC